MTNIVMMFVCLAAGLVVCRTRALGESAHVGLDAFVIHASLPSLILSQVHAVPLTLDLGWSIMMPWLLFLTSAGFFSVVTKLLSFPASTTGALILSAGLANTSIAGLPMIMAFYGPGSLPIGIMIGQLGTYLVLSTLGVAVACGCSGSVRSRSSSLLRIVTFPPLMALLLAAFLWRVEYPGWLSDLFKRLSDTLAPAALFSIGLQLRRPQCSEQWRALVLGLGFKLVLGPVAMLLLYIGLFHRGGDAMRVTIFEAAMGPQIGCAIVGAQYGLNPTLMTQMIGVGTVLSFLTIPLWWAGLNLI